jgi:hypothetical protein
MKKIFVFIGIMFSLFLLTGCSTNENERESIIKSLIRNEIIEGKRYKEIDVMHSSRYTMEWCERKDYYIYENKNGDKIAVTFDRKAGSKPKKYDVVVYFDIEEDKNIEYYDVEPEDCGEPVYRTNDEKAAKKPKYILKDSKKYSFTKDGSKYVLDE